MDGDLNFPTNSWMNLSEQQGNDDFVKPRACSVVLKWTLVIALLLHILALSIPFKTSDGHGTDPTKSTLEIELGWGSDMPVSRPETSEPSSQNTNTANVRVQTDSSPAKPLSTIQPLSEQNIPAAEALPLAEENNPEVASTNEERIEVPTIDQPPPANPPSLSSSPSYPSSSQADHERASEESLGTSLLDNALTMAREIAVEEDKSTTAHFDRRVAKAIEEAKIYNQPGQYPDDQIVSYEDHMGRQFVKVGKNSCFELVDGTVGLQEGKVWYFSDECPGMNDKPTISFDRIN
ncbi:hypothetical protein BTA51_24635 [Hahella sp. CCB-MM4]|nr:hypothetical protein BTA51_24635 [Hahella sp. CCB-MM4]